MRRSRTTFLLAILISAAVCSSSTRFDDRTLARGRNLAVSQATATTQLVGIVYDRDSRPGERATMRVTDDPKKYEKIPGLGVVVTQCPKCQRDASGHVPLQEMSVNTGDGRQQPANRPFTLLLPQSGGEVHASLMNQGGPTPVAQLDVPIPTGGGATQPFTGGARVAAGDIEAPSDFTTPPVCQDTSFIHGPLSGDGGVTRIMLDGQPTDIIAESPRSVYFDLPTGTPAGQHQLVIQDSSRGASFPVVRMSLTGHVDQPSLLRGQKTNYSVTVDFGELPESFWQRGGGAPPELVNPSMIRQAAPGFRIPQAGEPGVVLLAVGNASRDTVSLRPSQDERVVIALRRQDFQNNRFTTRGEIQSKKSGGFKLDLLAQAFFAPIAGQASEEPNPVIASTPGQKPRPCSELDCDPPSPSQREQNIFLTCMACATCAPSPCECQLWRRKKPQKDEPLGDPEFVSKQGKAGKKEEGYDYFCRCN
jgi:hypothetical protein